MDIGGKQRGPPKTQTAVAVIGVGGSSHSDAGYTAVDIADVDAATAAACCLLLLTVCGKNSVERRSYACMRILFLEYAETRLVDDLVALRMLVDCLESAYVPLQFSI